MAGSARIATVSALIFLTMSAGVFAGTNKRVPGGDVEAGQAGFRDRSEIPSRSETAWRVLTASPRTWPARTCCSTPAAVLNIMSTRPGMTSLSAGATPR